MMMMRLKMAMMMMRLVNGENGNDNLTEYHNNDDGDVKDCDSEVIDGSINTDNSDSNVDYSDSDVDESNSDVNVGVDMSDMENSLATRDGRRLRI